MPFQTERSSQEHNSRDSQLHRSTSCKLVKRDRVLYAAICQRLAFFPCSIPRSTILVLRFVSRHLAVFAHFICRLLTEMELQDGTEISFPHLNLRNVQVDDGLKRNKVTCWGGWVMKGEFRDESATKSKESI